MSVDGTAETIVEVPQQPSGLGWLPDGRMLVVSMLDRRVLRLEADGTSRRARRSRRTRARRVQRHGGRRDRTRVRRQLRLRHVRGRQAASTRASSRSSPTAAPTSPPTDSAFPNGTVITPDGATLLVGESMASRITAFDIARRRHARRTGASLGADRGRDRRRHLPRRRRRGVGGVPVHRPRPAHPRRRRGPRRGEGHASGRVRVHARRHDRTTLYICTAPAHIPDEARAAHGGRIEAVEVDVPGAGLP